MLDKTNEIELLIDNAAKAVKSEDALRYSQAACNAANALCALGTLQTMPAENPAPARLAQLLNWIDKHEAGTTMSSETLAWWAHQCGRFIDVLHADGFISPADRDAAQARIAETYDLLNRGRRITDATATIDRLIGEIGLWPLGSESNHARDNLQEAKKWLHATGTPVV